MIFQHHRGSEWCRDDAVDVVVNIFTVMTKVQGVNDSSCALLGEAMDVSVQIPLHDEATDAITNCVRRLFLFIRRHGCFDRAVELEQIFVSVSGGVQDFVEQPRIFRYNDEKGRSHSDT